VRHYPSEVNVTFANGRVIDLFKENSDNIITYVEVGTYKGYTAHHIAKNAKPGTVLYLLDFKSKEEEVTARVAPLLAPEREVEAYFIGNTDRMYDSYNWSLSKLLDKGIKIDFAYIDGAHTLHHDGLAFCLIDRMLNPGGIVCFDDYDWSIDRSLSMGADVYPEINEQYTEEQQKDPQVNRVVRQLVRTRDDYEEIVEDFAFRKLG